ncbi:MAG: hypothetical protein EPN85_06150 [Bacteroidetes bacterium]|nr:MAG: hypothetical protein EPN85_06150 [Bacteroidota bacterium]
MLKFIVNCFFFSAFLVSVAQDQSSPPLEQPEVGNAVRERESHDSSKVRKYPPSVAMLFSACVPGLGQAYNKKFWKIPLVYASMGTTIYFFNFNNKLYRKYKQAYVNKIDTTASAIDMYPEYSEAQLHELQSYHQKYRDLNVILTALFYTLNIVDAYVDAHLIRFDVSDDLSFHVLPALNMHAYRRKPSAGLTLTLTF